MQCKYNVCPTKPPSRHSIPPTLSIYLDLVKIAAAVIVVFSHTWAAVFPNFPLPWPGHSAVVIFFVLSGYVISHAARPELGIAGYAQHRIARIAPVSAVAVALSITIALFIDARPVGGGEPIRWTWEAMLRNLIFIGQSWTDALLPFNSPFWSLNYEVWYYVIFGLGHYRVKGSHLYHAMLCMAVLLAGPRILLLFPVWLMGTVLQRWMGRLSWRHASWLFVLTCLLGLLFFYADASVKIRSAMTHAWPSEMKALHGSNQFVGDILLGLIVSANFVAVGSLNFNWLLKYERPIRLLSSYTFSAYIFHMPLAILLWSALGVHGAAGFYACLTFGIFIFGWCTERHTRLYRQWLATLLPTPAKSVNATVETRKDAKPSSEAEHEIT